MIQNAKLLKFIQVMFKRKEQFVSLGDQNKIFENKMIAMIMMLVKECYRVCEFCIRNNNRKLNIYYNYEV